MLVVARSTLSPLFPLSFPSLIPTDPLYPVALALYPPPTRPRTAVQEVRYLLNKDVIKKGHPHISDKRQASKQAKQEALVIGWAGLAGFAGGN